MASHEHMEEGYSKIMSLCIQVMPSHARQIPNAVLQDLFRRLDESRVFCNANIPELDLEAACEVFCNISDKHVW